MSGGLRVVGLRLARGGRVLARDLSFAAAPGDALLVTGANGAGKSTLLRALAGLLRPLSGTIERPARVALLGEASALDPDRSLLDAVAFWARRDGGDARAALAAAALDHIADVPVRLLSTGQRRRAAFARVLASGAPLWLLDEPASGLDGAAAERLAASIAAHRASGGIVVAATHQPLHLVAAAEVAL